MPPDAEAAIRRTAAWAVRKLRAKNRRLSVRTLEPRQSRLWLGEFYENVKKLLFIFSEEGEADEPCDEPWQVLSFTRGDGLDALSHRDAYHLVFALTKTSGVLLVHLRNGTLDDVGWMRPERSGEGCFLELIVDGNSAHPTRERYLVMLWGTVDDGEAIRRQIRHACRTECLLPWIWGGRVDPDDATIIPELLRTFPAYRRLTLKIGAA